MLGAVVTVLITAALLDRQTASQQALIEKQTESQAALLEKQSHGEVERERGAKVFEEKLKSYDAFLTTLEGATKDGRVDANEVRLLVFQFGRLKMHTQVENVEEIARYVYELVTILHGPDAAESKNIVLQRKVLQIVGVFHGELSHRSSFTDPRTTVGLSRDAAEIKIGEYIQSLSEGDVRRAEEDTPPPALRAGNAAGQAGNARWTGKVERLWYANTGGGDWEEMRRHGFWSCGGGELWYRMALKPQAGDEICAYFSGMGYVAIGVVQAAATPLDALYAKHKWQANTGSRVEGDILRNPSLKPADQEWAIPVNWTATAPQGKAWRTDGMFASPMTLCRLRNAMTIEMLQDKVPPSGG